VQRSIALPVQVATGCVAFLESTNALWLATPSGQVATLRLADGRFSVRGSGYGAPAAVVPAADGLGLFVVEAGGAVFVAARSAPGRSAAVAVADLGAQAVAAALHPDGDALVALTAGPDGALVRCAVDTGVVAPVATGFEDPVAVTRPGIGVGARAIARWESLVLVVHDAGVVALE
jgi:hypothetical protein